MRVMGVLLCFCILRCFAPMTADALTGDQGYPGFTADDDYDIDGRPVLVFVTSGGGSVSRTKGSDGDTSQQYTATANSGWQFYKWLTYYEGPSDKGTNPNFTWSSEWCFSQPGNADAEYISSNSTVQVNREWDARGTYYLYAIFRPKLTVRSDVQSTVSYRCTRTISDAVYVPGNGDGNAEGYAPYKGTASVQAYIGDRIPVKVSVNNAETDGYYIENGWLYVNDFILECPINISISTRGKVQNVNFDANGGEGEMPGQTFYSGEEQKLSENSFTKTDYEFKCWTANTDGSGDEYENGESVAFSPETDGESITLYAQWKHAAHKGGTATCRELAECSVCGEEYGNHDKTNHVGGTELRNASEAEEFTDGYTGDTYCLGCNDLLAEGTVIPQTHEHRFINYVSDSDATCTENATETATCEGCAETDTREVEGTAGHIFVNYVSDNNAGCTKNCTETARCENCEETDTREIENTATGHSFVNYVSDSDATCTENATETAKCEHCEETDTKEVEGTAGHSFVNYVSDNNAGCTKNCTETARCENCEETDTREIEGTAKGHSYQNGECVLCGSDDPKYTPPKDAVPQTGEENTGMAIAVLFISFLIIVDYNYKRVKIHKKS